MINCYRQIAKRLSVLYVTAHFKTLSLRMFIVYVAQLTTSTRYKTYKSGVMSENYV